MKSNRRARSDDAVTDVLGTILMVGITVAMMVGLSLLILSIDGPDDKTFVDVAISLQPGGLTWGEGDEQITVLHRGGEAMLRDDTTITISINGVATTYEDADLDGDFADGRLILGESWIEAGLTVEANDTVSVNVISTSGNSVVASAAITASTSLAGATPPATTYVSSHLVTTASSSQNFANAQNASDSDAVASYVETTVPGGSSTTTLNPGNINNFNLPSGDGSAVKVDDNAKETFNSATNFIHVDQFDVPPAAVLVTNVVIGFEAERTSGGASDPRLQLTYSGIGGLPTIQTFDIATAPAEYTVDVTSDRIWTISNIESMVLKLSVILDTDKDVKIDHMYVTVTYNEAPQTDLEVEYLWSGVPDRSIEQFQIRYKATEDSFQVLVWNGATWTARGSLSSTTFGIFSYSMTTAEYNGGAPKIKFVDLDTGLNAGTLEIDYARVQSA